MSATGMAAETVITADSPDDAAIAIIHNLHGCTIDSYTGHMLTMSKEAGGVAGFAASVLNTDGQASGELGRIEYVFTLLQTPGHVDVFGHINSSQLLNNGIVKRTRLPDGDLQKFLDGLHTAQK